MSILPDKTIKKLCQSDSPMISPFEDKQNCSGMISYGVSSYGYDARVSNEFKIFTNMNSTVIDPKNFL